MTTIPMPNATTLVAPDLQARYSSTRALTEVLAGPLSPEDQTAQSMPDASPTKWHRGHTTWFFETFLLPGLPSYRPYHPFLATCSTLITRRLAPVTLVRSGGY